MHKTQDKSMEREYGTKLLSTVYFPTICIPSYSQVSQVYLSSLVFPLLLLYIGHFVFILKIQELRSIGVCNGLVT